MTDANLMEEQTFCEVHPTRETSLRCNKCGRYMCVDCAVSTPVGYRCKQCVRQHEDKFFSASQPDYVIIAAVCAALGAVGGFIASAINFLILLFIVGIPVGGFIAELALRAVKRRRGRYSGEIGAAAVAIGGLVGVMLHTYSLIAPMINAYAAEAPNQELPINPLSFVLQMTFSATSIAPLVFVGVLAFVVYSRFKMKM